MYGATILIHVPDHWQHIIDYLAATTNQCLINLTSPINTSRTDVEQTTKKKCSQPNYNFKKPAWHLFTKLYNNIDITNIQNTNNDTFNTIHEIANKCIPKSKAHSISLVGGFIRFISRNVIFSKRFWFNYSYTPRHHKLCE